MKEKIVIGDEGANERTVFFCPQSPRWCVKHGEHGRITRHFSRRAAILEAVRGVIADAWQFSNEEPIEVALNGIGLIEHGWSYREYCYVILGLTVLYIAREFMRQPSRRGIVKGYFNATVDALYSHNISVYTEDIALAAARIALEHFVEKKPWEELVDTALHEIGLTRKCKDKKAQKEV